MEENTSNVTSADAGVTPSSKGPKIIGGIAILAIIGALIAWFSGKSGQRDMTPTGASQKNGRDVMKKSSDAPGMENPAMNPENSDATKPTDGAMMEKGSYKDGEYSATGAYTSPAGAESIDITVALKDGVVTNVAFTGNAENEKSKFFQEKFSEGIASQVVGKSIDSLQLTVVNGSSLTPKGFMDALQKIEQEAKA